MAILYIVFFLECIKTHTSDMAILYIVFFLECIFAQVSYYAHFSQL